MTDQRTGKVHNYSSVRGLLAEGLVNWHGTAEGLWNAAEASETRRNARVARELRPALPAELPLDDQRRLVHGFCCWMKDQYGIAAHWVIHAPTFYDENEDKRRWRDRGSEKGWKEYLGALCDSEKTNRNFHSHIRWTTRKINRETGEFGKKTRELDAKDTGPEKLKQIRTEWQRRTNAALMKIGSPARIDLRSYEEMAKAGDAPPGLEFAGAHGSAQHGENSRGRPSN